MTTLKDTFLNSCLTLIKSSPAIRGVLVKSHLPAYLQAVVPPTAKAVPNTLSNLIKQGRIEFRPLGRQNLVGVYHEKLNFIQVDNYFYTQKDVAGASAILFHETAHAVLKAQGFDEEIVAHSLDLSFFNSLNAANKMKSQGLQSDMNQLSMAVKNGKLIEYLLNFKRYQDLLTLDWILKNINNYGGLTRLSGKVKKLYIDCTCKTYTRKDNSPQEMVSPAVFLKFILKILDSAKGNKVQFYEMISHDSLYTITTIATKHLQKNDSYYREIQSTFDRFRKQYQWEVR